MHLNVAALLQPAARDAPPTPPALPAALLAEAPPLPPRRRCRRARATSALTRPPARPRSLLDAHWKEGMTEEEGMHPREMCIAEINTRFMINMPNWVIKVVDKNGVRTLRKGPRRGGARELGAAAISVLQTTADLSIDHTSYAPTYHLAHPDDDVADRDEDELHEEAIEAHNEEPDRRRLRDL